jgi:hypothetical protein
MQFKAHLFVVLPIDFHFFLTMDDTLLTLIVHGTQQHIRKNNIQ